LPPKRASSRNANGARERLRARRDGESLLGFSRPRMTGKPASFGPSGTHRPITIVPRATRVQVSRIPLLYWSFKCNVQLLHLQRCFSTQYKIPHHPSPPTNHRSPHHAPAGTKHPSPIPHPSTHPPRPLIHSTQPNPPFPPYTVLFHVRSRSTWLRVQRRTRAVPLAKSGHSACLFRGRRGEPRLRVREIVEQKKLTKRERESC